MVEMISLTRLGKLNSESNRITTDLWQHRYLEAVRE